MHTPICHTTMHTPVCHTTLHTPICHTTMPRNPINFLYNPGHMIFGCVKVGSIANAREGSLGKPRNDGLQANVNHINNLLRSHFINDNHIKLCHHENLLAKGQIKTELFTSDQYHLNTNGTKVLAANLRYELEGRRLHKLNSQNTPQQIGPSPHRSRAHIPQ